MSRLRRFMSRMVPSRYPAQGVPRTVGLGPVEQAAAHEAAMGAVGIRASMLRKAQLLCGRLRQLERSAPPSGIEVIRQPNARAPGCQRRLDK